MTALSMLWQQHSSYAMGTAMLWHQLCHDSSSYAIEVTTVMLWQQQLFYDLAAAMLWQLNYVMSAMLCQLCHGMHYFYWRDYFDQKTITRRRCQWQDDGKEFANVRGFLRFGPIFAQCSLATCLGFGNLWKEVIKQFIL